MIRHYCDRCDAEIVADKNDCVPLVKRGHELSGCFDMRRLSGAIQTQRGNEDPREWMLLSVSTGLGCVWERGHFCRHCVVDALTLLVNGSHTPRRSLGEGDAALLYDAARFNSPVPVAIGPATVGGMVLVRLLETRGGGYPVGSTVNVFPEQLGPQL